MLGLKVHVVNEIKFKKKKKKTVVHSKVLQVLFQSLWNFFQNVYFYEI